MLGPHHSFFKPRLHDTTCCQTGLTTGLTNGCIVYTASCQTGCTTRFDNRLNEQWLLVQHGCQTDLATSWMFVYAIQPVVKPVVQPVVSCKRSFRGWMLFLTPNQQCQRTDSNTAIIIT